MPGLRRREHPEPCALKTGIFLKKALPKAKSSILDVNGK
jgi:hypothetical protein